MAVKDLTQFLSPDLVLALGGNTYTVRPPSRDAGLKMAAIVAMGTGVYLSSTQTCPTCGRSGEVEISQETRDLVEAVKDEPLGNLSLGSDVLAQMDADGLPEAHQDQAALYALYYWVLGETAADAVISAQAGEPEPETPKA